MSTDTGQSREQALQDRHRSSASWTSGECHPARTSVPFAISWSTRARPRVESFSSLVARNDGHMKPPAAPLSARHLPIPMHRCIGMGKCRADNGAAGGFMCPSFLATRDEKDSTRGRARVLQEMANGTLVRAGWHSPEVHDALDLCLSCKACSRDCPVSVDMATYKSEVLHQAYHGRARPRSHYVLGWLPRWTRMAAVAPGLASAALRMKPVAGAVRWLGGIDPRRPLPALDPHPATPGRLRQLAASVTAPDRAGERVVVWADTFTRAFTPQLCEAAVAVLAEAGFDVVVPGRASCC